MAQFTKYSGTVTGQVGSIITMLDAGLVTGQSWTTPFTGTNKKAYKLPAGSGFYMRVDDNGTGTGGAKEALIRGGEVMTDVDTFSVNPFPSNAQSALTANSLIIRKSATADSTTRRYKMWADGRTFHAFIESDVAGDWFAFHYGDFYDLVTSPAYNCGISARSGENSASSSNERVCMLQTGQTTAGIGYFVARGHTGTGTSVLMGRHAGDGVAKGTGNDAFQGAIPWKNPADGAFVACQVWLHDTVTAVINGNRGRMRGLWCPLHPTTSYNDGDIIAGTGDLSGKTFELIKTVYATTVGVCAIETSNTLETN